MTSFTLVDINGDAVLATGSESNISNVVFNSDLTNPMVRTDRDRFGHAYCGINIISGKHREVLEDIMGALSGTNPFVVIGDDVTGEYISKHITSMGTLNINYDPDGLDVAEDNTSATLKVKTTHSTGS